MKAKATMWSDPIVEEVRKNREAYAAKFNYDLMSMYEDLKKQQKASKRKYVTLPSKKPVILPNVKIKKT